MPTREMTLPAPVPGSTWLAVSDMDYNDPDEPGLPLAHQRTVTITGQWMRGSKLVAAKFPPVEARGGCPPCLAGWRSWPGSSCLMRPLLAKMRGLTDPALGYRKGHAASAGL